MLNFKDRNLYKKDEKKVALFKNHILVKESEKDLDLDDYGGGFDDDNSYNRIDSSTIVDSQFDFGSGDSDGGFGDFGFGGDDDFGFGSGSFGGFNENEEDENGITARGNLKDYQTHRYFENINKALVFLTAPIFLFWYIILHIDRNNMKVHDWKNELEYIKKINIGVIVISIVFMVLGVNTIISLKTQLITGIVMLLFSIVMIAVIDGKFKKGEKEEFATDTEEDDSIFDFDGGYSEDTAGYDGEFDFLGAGDDDEDDFFAGLSDVDDGLIEEVDEDNTTKFGKSILEVHDDDAFDKSLVKVFKMNDKFKGTGAKGLPREQLVNSFAPYLATNFTDFGQWSNIGEGTYTYLNIAYTIFLGLEKINNGFGKAKIDKDTGEKIYEKLIITEMKENTMMYKIQVDLPPMFKEKTLLGNINEFKNLLKQTENDYDTKLSISSFGTGFTFKFYKPIKGIISIGDLLRYKDPSSDAPTSYEQFIDEGKGLPMLMGLVNSEYPEVIDYEENTSGVIVGGSGSGKSWFTFSMLFNILVSNDYHNVQMMIFDKKNAPFWNMYALSPHVIGYHTQVEDLRAIVDEVYAEVSRRKELLNEVGAENFKGLRKTLRKKGKTEEMKRFPLLLFIVDEITSTMSELKEQEDNGENNDYKHIRSVMSKITQEGRSLGVRMLAIGQRSIDTSVPKNVMANSSFKFGMKLDTASDFNSLDMEDAIKKIGAPDGMGLGIMKTMDSSDFKMVKTLGVGGMNDEQILHLLRVMGLEWTRRSFNDDFNYETTNIFKLGYNRDKFREKALKYLREGYIIDNLDTNGISYDIDNRGNLLSETGIVEDISPNSNFSDDAEDDDFGFGSATVVSDDDDDFGFGSATIVSDDDDDDDFGFGSATIVSDDDDDDDDDDDFGSDDATVISGDDDIDFEFEDIEEITDTDFNEFEDDNMDNLDSDDEFDNSVGSSLSDDFDSVLIEDEYEDDSEDLTEILSDDDDNFDDSFNFIVSDDGDDNIEDSGVVEDTIEDFDIEVSDAEDDGIDELDLDLEDDDTKLDLFGTTLNIDKHKDNVNILEEDSDNVVDTLGNKGVNLPNSKRVRVVSNDEVDVIDEMMLEDEDDSSILVPENKQVVVKPESTVRKTKSNPKAKPKKVEDDDVGVKQSLGLNPKEIARQRAKERLKKRNESTEKTPPRRSNSKGGLVVKPKVKSDTENKPKMSKLEKLMALGKIKDYIKENGEGSVLRKKISKDELHAQFNSEEIAFAIDNNVLVSEGDYFVLVAL